MRGARFLGLASTPPDYELIDLGHYPGLVIAGKTAVVGELYEVDASKLAKLDEFESTELYTRTVIELADGARAQTYVFNDAGAPGVRVVSGDWRAYLAGRRR